MADKANLNPEVAAKFKMAKNFAPGVYHFKGAPIDLTSASLETVQKAVDNGFDVVEPIKEAKAVK